MFDIYWIFRTIFITYYSIVAYRRFQEGKKIDWWERCQNIAHPKEYAQAILEKIKSLNVHWHAKWDHSSKRYYAKATGRVALGQRKSGFYMHMIVMDFDFNKIEWKVIDHINQNTLDNRKCNLRVSELNENTKHRSRINSNNSSGYRNVSFDGRGNPIVQLQDNGKNTVWRGFKTPEEANEFAKIKRKELYGEFAGED